MLDNKETTQNYFKGLTRKDYIERVCKIMEKDGAEDLSIRRIAKELGIVRQLHYTVILTASRN